MHTYVLRERTEVQGKAISARPIVRAAPLHSHARDQPVTAETSPTPAAPNGATGSTLREASEPSNYEAAFPRLTLSHAYVSPPGLPPPSQGLLPACGSALWPGGIRTRWTDTPNFRT